MAWTSSKWGKFWVWRSILPWRSRSIVPQNSRDLNQGLLHLWSKCGDPSWNGYWVITRTSSWLTHRRTHIQTDAGNDNTRRPKLASRKNYSISKLKHVRWVRPLLVNRSSQTDVEIIANAVWGVKLHTWLSCCTQNKHIEYHSCKDLTNSIISTLLNLHTNFLCQIHTLSKIVT